MRVPQVRRLVGHPELVAAQRAAAREPEAIVGKHRRDAHLDPRLGLQ